MILYDVPGRTGMSISAETYEAARQIDTITSVKDATGDPTHSVLLTDLGYHVYSGDDALILGYLAHGACGLVSVVGHAAGSELASVMESFLGGDHAAALEAYLSAAESQLTEAYVDA